MFSSLILFFLSFLAFSSPALASGEAGGLSGRFEVAPGSAIHFLSIKNHDTPVPGSFRTVTGFVELRGSEVTGTIFVPLRSLDTGNPGRDRNILLAFFEESTYPEARFELREVRGFEPRILTQKRSSTVEVEGVLVLHGLSLPLQTHLMVSLLSNTEVVVQTLEPLILKVSELKMEAPLQALMKLCAHQDVTPVFPVTLTLHLVRAR